MWDGKQEIALCVLSSRKEVLAAYPLGARLQWHLFSAR